jgi:RNA polymerase sigma-70 factor (ECF subfamily)
MIFLFLESLAIMDLIITFDKNANLLHFYKIFKRGAELIMESFNSWFDELYTKHAPRMVRAARRILDNEELAEDIVQNVFIILLAKQEEIRNHENPTGWLYLTLRNQIGNEMQKEKYRKSLPLDERLAAEEDRYHFPLRDCLPEGLTEDEKEILIFVYEMDLTYEEISERLGRSVLACRTRLHRAKIHCRKLLT